MIKETVKYKDFLGGDQTADLYFHLSKSELIELELGMEGGLGAHLQEMVKSQQPARILAAFKKIISVAYGERTEDGKRFIKDDEKTKLFMKSPEFDALLWMLATNETEVTKFILGLVPTDLIEAAGGEEALLSGKAINTIAIPPAPDEEPKEKPWADREPTPGELRGMSREELLEVFQRKVQGPPQDTPPAA